MTPSFRKTQERVICVDKAWVLSKAYIDYLWVVKSRKDVLLSFRFAHIFYNELLLQSINFQKFTVKEWIKFQI